MALAANDLASYLDKDIQSFLESQQRDYANEVEITGRIAQIYFSSPTFTTGKIYATTGPYMDSECKFSIAGQLTAGEEVTLHGKWNKHSKYGWQFQVESIAYPMPEMTGSGLAEYLASNPAFKGIGPAKAEAIAKAFSDNFDTAIRETPQRMAEIGKLTPEQLSVLQNEWIARADVNAISMWLASYGLTHGQIKKIASQYGNKAKQILTENPYILCNEVHGFGFSRTDEIALKMGIAKDHPGRIRACLVDMVKTEAEDGGHTYIERKSLISKAIDKLAFDTLNAENMIQGILQSLCDSNELVSREHGKGQVLIAFRNTFDMEMDLMRWFRESQSDALKPLKICRACVDFAIEEYVLNGGPSPNAQQSECIYMALNNRVSVMSGTAGTGKSYTIARINELFNKTSAAGSKQIGLAAPTGKAAKRMSHLAAGANASTIHRLLSYDPIFGGFQYNKNCKLSHDLIVIDEVSMCDIWLLWSLFSAIDFHKTQVLLVGDHNQLPPIGAGNTLRDVLYTGILPYNVLTECIRSAGELKINCNALLDGVINPSSAKLADGCREWFLIDNVEEVSHIIESLQVLMESRFEEWGFDPIQDCQIIIPQNKGKLGVHRINAEMQRVWQRKKYGVELPAVPEDDKLIHIKMLVGDKIMQVKNDYDTGAMNGTQGVIESIGIEADGKNYMSINFDDMPEAVKVEVGGDKAKNIVLAYACTIHKVQGSEYPCVVAIIHSAHTYMLSRNLIYTAATRARRTAILLGNKAGMKRAAKTTTPMERRTWTALGMGL